MLDTLIAVVKAKPKERELCCPDCGGSIVLAGGLLLCGAGHGRETLAELAVGAPTWNSWARDPHKPT